MEELKLILNTLATMGPHAKEAFYVWLFADKAVPWLGFFLLLWGLNVIVSRVVCYLQADSLNGNRLRALRDRMVGERFGEVTFGEFDRMLQQVRETRK